MVFFIFVRENIKESALQEISGCDIIFARV